MTARESHAERRATGDLFTAKVNESLARLTARQDELDAAWNAIQVERRAIHAKKLDLEAALRVHASLVDMPDDEDGTP